MRTNAAQIASVEASAKPTKGVDEQVEAPEGSGWHMEFGARTRGHPNSTCFRRSGCLSRPM